MNRTSIAVALGLALFSATGAMAQPDSSRQAPAAATRTLSLDSAIQMGLRNSKTLKRSQFKIDQAMNRVDQAKDAYLPSAKLSFQYLHALMLTQTVNLPGITAADKPLKLPFDFPAYLGTLAVSEPVFAGNQLKYARQSANLLVQASRLDADKDREDITWVIISSYLNYNKILQNQLIVEQNMEDVQGKLDQITKYEGQGLATQNDVLRFQLQKSQIQLTRIELEDNRKIANYNLNILLGLPDSTEIKLPAVAYRLDEHPAFVDFVQQAETNRRELQDLDYQQKLADINVRKIQDQRLPTVTANMGMYYINPTGKPIPTDHTVLAPLTLGIGASWDIASLYTNKNKVKEASIQRQSLTNDKDDALDEIRKEVHQSYIGYLQSLERIKVLQDAVTQAQENERIMESKFRNNLVNTTDRIDAQTLLYQARVNLELAKSDATIAYYSLLRSTGHIQP
ncbi:MAG: TolC family protein [Bacteroidota bacterium]|nr:TolC family protein [Bacteroidota bacterium]MDP4217389.1 TolC family protein [Bacteroidota bacterium]MDP4245723.1 TolC family protein [Bacteroidota bacterium]MDP4254258.1 TolC family protein [Bacteroidota bacterium]MDP4260717.1 TolC family protein [Bacteroidota bacterium]